MNNRNLIGIAVLVVAVAFAIQLVQQNQAEARHPVQDEVQSTEFAILELDGSDDKVTWRIGGNQRVRTETVGATYRRLGGTAQGTFSNLLNQIGSDGWNLVQKDGNVWIFSRRAS